jgi:SAM-dependent methyltransferase
MILYILVILLLLYILASTSKCEGFENKTFINSIHDKFYSTLYDHIWNMIPFYTAQIELMKPYFATTNNCLCFDSKTGHMPQLLSNNMKVVGLDNSKDMIEISKKKYPNIPFIQGDCDPSIFKNNLFTHIYCPLFSINTKDIELFIECVDKWLVHKGYIFIVTYNSYNTYNSLNISKFLFQESIVKFDIELNDNLVETISFDNKKRKNIHYLNKVDLKEFHYKLIKKIDIPGYHCYLNIYQKTM